MTESRVFPLVMRMSVPTTMSMLITSVYNMADTYFVSSLGNSATSAVGIVFAIQSIIQAIGYGFGMGAQSLISRRLGEKKREEAELYAVSAFAAAFLMGLLITALGFIDLPAVMKIFGSTETALPYAVSYGKWILMAAPIFCSSFVLNNVLRAQGKAALSMVGLCSGGILNIGLDALFIMVLKFGVEGAAIATVLSQCVSFSILLLFFISGKSDLRLILPRASKSLRDYISIFKVGLPTVFRQSLGSIAATLLNHAVKPYGDTAVAAVTISNKIYMLLRSMIIGVGQGFQPVAGFNYGAKRYDRVKKSFWTAVFIGSFYCIAAALILFFFSGSIISLFRKGDGAVIEIGSQMLRYLCVSMVFLAYSTFVNQLFQCLGYVIPATVLASCRQGIFFVPLILILPGIIGLAGIQVTQALADLITAAVSVPFNIWMLRHLNGMQSGKQQL